MVINVIIPPLVPVPPVVPVEPIVNPNPVTTDVGFFDAIIGFFESIWSAISLFLNQVTSTVRFLLTSLQVTDIISYVLPISLSAIALIFISIAVVKSVLGR